MGKTGAGLFLAILVVAALGAGYLAVSSGRQASETVQTTSVSSSETVQGNAQGSDGLQLFVSLNASQLAPGQALQVNVSISNTFSTTNRLPVSDGFPFQGIPLAVWPDCDLMLLGSPSVGFNASDGAEAVVLKGNYEINNITSVADIHFPVFGCTTGMKVEQVAFGRLSAQANLTGPSGRPNENETLGPYHVAGTFTTNGYWDLRNNSERAADFLNYEGQQTIDSPITTLFTPGVYTVGIEDVWGQAVILHFDVTG